MKKRITLFLLAAALPMAASGNSDELMSAQAAFRQALAAQNSTDAGLTYLQQRLEDAQRRKASAEADVQAYSQKLAEAQQQKAANDSALKQAGERLNAAWQAVHGNR